MQVQRGRKIDRCRHKVHIHGDIKRGGFSVRKQNLRLLTFFEKEGNTFTPKHVTTQIFSVSSI